MKNIIELQRAIKSKSFYDSQFQKNGKEKNILFVNPQLSGKQLYRALLPYFSMYNENIYTAITDISKYNDENHLLDVGDVKIGAKEILWADYIVFPFTVQLLVGGKDAMNVYDAIRAIDPNTVIVFSVDFNFFELSERHPYKPIFSDSKNFNNVLDNIWYSDLVMVTNLEFQKYLIEKLNAMNNKEFAGVDPHTSVACLPFIFDAEILLKNVDYDPERTIKVVNREIVEKINKEHDKIKEKDLKTKKTTGNGKSSSKSTGKSSSKSTGKSTSKSTGKKPKSTERKPAAKKLAPKKDKASKNGDNKPQNK